MLLVKPFVKMGVLFDELAVARLMLIYQALHGSNQCTMLSSLFCYTDRTYHEDTSSGFRLVLTVRFTNYLVFLDL